MPDADPAHFPPNPAVRVRRATVRDLAALIDLENATFTHDRMSPRQWRRHLHNDRAALLVAVHGNDLAGAAVVFFRRRAAVARLYSIAVAQAQRGRGIGRLLLAAAEAETVRRGRRALRLEVRAGNASAQRTYEAAGYARFGAIPDYYEDGEAAWRYQKPLAAADVRRKTAAISPVRS